MLNVVFGRNNTGGNFILDNRVLFKRYKKPEWFEDDFIKSVLKGIDGAEVLFEEALKDRYGHGISTMMISTGSKTLCCIYYNVAEGKYLNGSMMGKNCVPYLMEIARKRDVYIFLEHYMDIPTEYFEEGLIKVDGKVVGEYDYDDAFSDWGVATEEAED